MLELSDVAKTYGQTAAVKPLSVSVPAGQTIVILGPSGCGKSTLIRMMIGLVVPDQGQVCFRGQDVNGKQQLAIRQQMGYVIQGGGLFPHLTGRQNSLLLSRYLRSDREHTLGRLDQLRELTHLHPAVLDQYPAQMSGGQQQRVSLIRALMLDPELVLLDEPLGALDPLIRSDLQRDLREIFRSLNKTVVMVTHDIGEAAFLADRVVVMRHGEIVQSGTVQDLVDHPADPFVTEFISAQSNSLNVQPNSLNVSSVQTGP